MVLMCLDHTREFFTDIFEDPTDLETATPVLFFTRWVTHFCAPTFVFLAGVSAYLYGQKAGSRSKLAAFLVTRGLWLLFLEFTVVYFAWLLCIGLWPLMFIIIAAIGFSMIALAGLIYLPLPAIAVIGVGIVTCHNFADPVKPDDLGAFAPLWVFLHEGGPIPEIPLLVGYPVLAWIGIIACGYAFGHAMTMDTRQRIRTCLTVGTVCTAAFVILRWVNYYGDPAPWSQQQDGLFTVMSFLKCTKYPPSLLFTLMTLGPALIVMAVFDIITSRTERPPVILQPLLVFGRVPLFFYVAHLYLIHLSSRLWYWIKFGEPISSTQVVFGHFAENRPIPDFYGFDLTVTYIAWIIMLAVLYPLCLYFGRLKKNGKSPVWSYL